MIRKIFLSTIIMLITVCIPCLAATEAESYDSDENNDWCQIEIEVNAPEDFSDDLTVYLDSVPIRICRSNPADTSFKVTAFCAPGSKEVRVITSSLEGADYILTYPESFMAEEGGVLNISIEKTTDSEGEYDSHVHEALTDTALLTATASSSQSVTDLAGGSSEYAQLTVKCAYYSAVQSVIFSLLGPELIDIELSRSNNFTAYVKLPCGSYKELALTEITLDEDADGEGYKFSFSHTASNSYGNVYELSPDNITVIDDLIINMQSGDGITEADSALLYAPRMLKNVSAVNDERIKEAMPETSEESQKDISLLLPEDESKSSMLTLIIIIVILGLISIIAFLIYLRRRK